MLVTLTFAIAFSVKKQGCGPEVPLWRDCTEKVAVGKEIHSEVRPCFRQMKRVSVPYRRRELAKTGIGS